MGILIFIIVSYVYYLFFRKKRKNFVSQYPDLMQNIKDNQKSGEGENGHK